MRWYLEGARHPQHGRLLSARLAASTAKSYWHRFQLFVAFVEKREGQQKKVLDYMQIDRVEACFSSLGEGIVKKGGKVEPPSSGWLDTVKRTLNSIAYCFVFPEVTDETWATYMNRMLNAKSFALKGAQSMGRAKQRGDFFVVDPNRADGGFFVKAPEPTWEATLGRVAAYEGKVQAWEWTFQDPVHKQA